MSLVGIVIATSLACVAVDGSRSRAAPYVALRGLVQRESPLLAVVEADLHQPYLFFSGYAPGERVGLLRGIPDRVVVDLDGDRFDIGELAAGTLLIARRPEMRRWLAEQPQLRAQATFPPPDDLYHRLLRNRHVQAILSIGRSEFRMDALRGTAGGDGTIEVFQIH